MRVVFGRLVSGTLNRLGNCAFPVLPLLSNKTAKQSISQITVVQDWVEG